VGVLSFNQGRVQIAHKIRKLQIPLIGQIR